MGVGTVMGVGHLVKGHSCCSPCRLSWCLGCPSSSLASKQSRAHDVPSLTCPGELRGGVLGCVGGVTAERQRDYCRESHPLLHIGSLGWSRMVQ